MTTETSRLNTRYKVRMEVYDTAEKMVYIATHTVDYDPWAREGLSRVLEFVAEQMDKEVPHDEDH